MIFRNSTNLLVCLAVSALLFGFLWVRDYPKPHLDDLYYTGAALHLAEGGDFSNPLIERQENPSHFFFVYPPLHSKTLATWLKIFGISARSMTGFQILLYFITACSAILILHRHAVSSFMYWLAPLGVITALLPVGLRTETLSVALTMAGLAMVECWALNVAAIFVGFLLMFLGGAAAPRLTMFSAVLILYSAWRLCRRPDGKGTGVLISVAVAFICSLLIFLAQIHFQVGEFWHTFHTHSKLVQRRKLDMLLSYLNGNDFIDGSQLPLVWALAAVILFGWPLKKSNSLWLGLAMVGGFFLEALAGGIGGGTLWYVAFALLLISAAVIKDSPRLEFKLTGVIVFLFLVANVSWVIFEYQRAFGRVTMDRGELAQTAREMRSTPEHPVLIDGSTARYVYNYHIPQGFLDIQAAARFPKTHVIQQLQPNDIYVIGPQNVETLKGATFLSQPIKVRSVFGLYNHHIIAEPCRVYIIPAEKCVLREGEKP